MRAMNRWIPGGYKILPGRALSALALLLLWCLAPLHVYAQSAALIEPGSEWRYNDSGKDLGAAWRESGYDDSGWKRGKAPLGYAVSALQTTLGFGGDVNQKYPTYYFRRIFSVD